LPVGIEHNLANWEKISVFVGYTLTQAHTRVKKVVWILMYRINRSTGISITLQIKESIKANTNVFTLAQQIVH